MRDRLHTDIQKEKITKRSMPMHLSVCSFCQMDFFPRLYSLGVLPVIDLNTLLNVFSEEKPDSMAICATVSSVPFNRFFAWLTLYVARKLRKFSFVRE